jgi:hypothetical protein
MQPVERYLEQLYVWKVLEREEELADAVIVVCSFDVLCIT